MTVPLLTEHHLEFLSLKGGCTGLYEHTLVKLHHCWEITSRLIYKLLASFGTVYSTPNKDELTNTNFGLNQHGQVQQSEKPQ